MLDLNFHPRWNETVEGSLEASADHQTSWVDLTLSSGDRTLTLTIFFKGRADMLAFTQTLAEDCKAALAKYDEAALAKVDAALDAVGLTAD
jgi:hypothetical protein